MILAIVLINGGCSIKYSFSGASISPDVKTATIVYFQNMATMVAPSLSPTFNDMLTQKIQRETRLQIIRDGSTPPADVTFEGQIFDYRSDPIAISGDEHAVKNRLTIAIKVKFTNNKEPNLSFERNFSEYADYNSSELLTSIEGTLIPEIVTKLVQNIFNEAFSQW